jgi:hypothetical protein
MVQQEIPICHARPGGVWGCAPDPPVRSELFGNRSVPQRRVRVARKIATRDEHGQWRLDPAEVSRVYPIAVGDAEQQHAIARKRDRTDELVALLQEQLAQMGKELERVRTDAETWRNAFETERAQRLLPAPTLTPAPADTTSATAAEGRWRRAWRWMRATG